VLLLLHQEPLMKSLTTGNNMDAIKKLQSMSPESRAKLKWNDPIIVEYTKAVEDKLGLPEGVGRAILYAENRGTKHDSHTVSSANARGLMQMTDHTMKLRKGEWKHNPLDPVENIFHALRFYKEILENEYKGNIKAAFAGYNGGPENGKPVLKGKPPVAEEARGYLEKTKEWYTSYVKEKAVAKQEPPANETVADNTPAPTTPNDAEGKTGTLGVIEGGPKPAPVPTPPADDGPKLTSFTARG